MANIFEDEECQIGKDTQGQNTAIIQVLPFLQEIFPPPVRQNRTHPGGEEDFYPQVGSVDMPVRLHLQRSEDGSVKNY